MVKINYILINNIGGNKLSLLNFFPLTDPQRDKDVLGFETQAKQIATLINKNSPSYPLAIAINGPWGSGKSTMANFIMGNLDKSCQAILFNPWLVSDKETLVANLFEEIFIRLRKHDENAEEKNKNLSRQFLTYAKRVLPSSVKALTYITSLHLGIEERNANFISGVMGDFSKEVRDEYVNMSLSELKQNLEVEMKKEFVNKNKKIVVFIDEIDRLLPDEIVTVLKMIRSTLSLPGLLFVASMDNRAVTEALVKAGIKEPSYYLEKIFQFNYNISTKSQVKTLVKEIMYSSFELSEEEAFKDLKGAIEAYLMGNKNFKLIEINNYEEFTQDFGLSANYMVYQLNEIEQADFTKNHSMTCKSILEELNIEVPRNFINITNYILEFWPNYYSELFKDVHKCNFNVKLSFLLFLLMYKYPQYCDTTYILEDKGENLPIFVQGIREHIKYYIPKFTNVTVTPREYIMDDSFLRFAIGLLNKFPDQIEELGELSRRKDALLEEINKERRDLLDKLDEIRGAYSIS
jgi:ABC-type dipeptide/oligopeptide/nickel transport system ATPase component